MDTARKTKQSLCLLIMGSHIITSTALHFSRDSLGFTAASTSSDRAASGGSVHSNTHHEKVAAEINITESTVGVVG